MYNIPYFKADSQQEVLDFMHNNPFIILTGCDAQHKPVATHIPVLIEEREGNIFLIGHMMTQTDHHKAFIINKNALAIFTGPHAYVSASWYTNKKQASTWNYLTVHAKGLLKFLGEDDLIKVLHTTTAHFENNPASPSLVPHLEEDYVQRLMKAIVAFEIEVTEVDHVFKLSQNRDEESYQSIISNLKQGDEGAVQIAEVMKKRNQEKIKN